MTAATPPTEWVTVRDLFNSQLLRLGQLLGGAQGLDTTVHDVILARSPSDINTSQVGTAVVLDLSPLGVKDAGTHRQHLCDVACRRLYALGGRLLVIAGDSTPPARSTGRVADRMKLPVVVVDHPSPAGLTAQLLAFVSVPEVLNARVLGMAVRLLHRAGVDQDQVLAALSSVLAARVAVVMSDGTVFSGDPVARRSPPVPHAPGVATVSDGVRVWCPIGDVEGPVDLWLVAEAQDPGPAWERVAITVLELGASRLSSWFMAERLRLERDVRYRSTLLEELLGVGDAVPSTLAERAAALGWRLDRWHIGIHLATLDGLSPQTAYESLTVSKALSDIGVSSGLVERADGWSAWLSGTRETLSPSLAQLAGHLKAELEALFPPSRESGIVAGLGRSQWGSRGLTASLAEARAACSRAISVAQSATVLTIDDLKGSELLLGWYATPTLRNLAADMLDPLAGDRELIETLEVYLDQGRSPSATAAHLGIHRNTVAQRIKHAEGLLKMRMDEPDHALAAQLACRLRRCRPAK